MSTTRITLDIPDDLLRAESADPTAFGRELSMQAAVRLYQLGRISSGRAAALAGIGRIEFLSRLAEFEIFPLEADLKELEARNFGSSDGFPSKKLHSLPRKPES